MKGFWKPVGLSSGIGFLIGFARALLMHKQAFVLGLLFILVSITLTVVLNELAASYADLQPLAIMALILLAVGTVVTGYSIWDEVMGRSGPSTESSR